MGESCGRMCSITVRGLECAASSEGRRLQHCLVTPPGVHRVAWVTSSPARPGGTLHRGQVKNGLGQDRRTTPGGARGVRPEWSSAATAGCEVWTVGCGRLTGRGKGGLVAMSGARGPGLPLTWPRCPVDVPEGHDTCI
jgi:hypothetical protein